MTSYLNDARRRAHKVRNIVHSVVLVLGLGLLMSVCAWILSGWSGVVWAIAAVAVAVLIAPRLPPEMVMRMYRARPLDAASGGRLFALVDALSARAELPEPPRLYIIPSTTLNAFATGSPERASIAVTSGMLERLSYREVAGVLAHEISHVRNNDLWIMGLADTLSRMTQVLAYLGVFLLILNLPALITGKIVVPWLVPLLLYLAPTVGSLLQLALSRAREYDADLEGAELTGDPVGLASALDKVERYQGRFWEDMLLPGRRIPQPSLLRSHPPTEERVRRLLELAPPRRPAFTWPHATAPHASSFAALNARPRYYWPGVWF